MADVEGAEAAGAGEAGAAGAAGTAGTEAAGAAGAAGAEAAGAAGTVAAARRALGPVGVTLPVSFDTALDIGAQRDAVRRLEDAGCRAVWTNEVVGGKDALVQLAVLLAATRRTAFGTCIANIWARQPQTLHGAASVLAQAFPGRFVLGLGVGYPQQAAAAGREFGRPLATMRDYCARMHEPTAPPAPDAPYPRIVAANGPKMLALAAEVADGALPAVRPPEFTARARAALGPGGLLVVGVSVVLDPDPERARAAAREAVAARLAEPGFAAAMRQLGYEQREIDAVGEAGGDGAAGGDGDRLVSALVAHGGPEAVAAGVRRHLAAGADHVALLPPIGTPFASGAEALTDLVAALPALR